MFVSIVVIPADAYELQFLNKPIITILSLCGDSRKRVKTVV